MPTDLKALLSDLTSGDDALAESTVASLVLLGRKSIKALGKLRESPEVDIRWWALRALAQFELPPITWFVASLSDPSSEVRQCAALGLCHHPSEEAVPALIRLLSDADSVTANLAASALIAIGTPAVPALLDVMKDAPHMARLEAICALASIADQRSIPVLMAALEQDSPSMHYWAEMGLEKLGLDMVYMKFD